MGDPFNTFIVWLAAYGITFAIAESKLLSFVRDPLKQASTFFVDMFSCMFCTGFWVSFVMNAFLFKDLAELDKDGWAFANAMLYGTFSSAAAIYIIDAAVQRLERE